MLRVGLFPAVSSGHAVFANMIEELISDVFGYFGETGEVAPESFVGSEVEENAEVEENVEDTKKIRSRRILFIQI
jgi:hypothetical protein